MVAATLLWSTAGVVSRQLESAGRFEATFWRSGFAALALFVLLGRLRGLTGLGRAIRSGGAIFWISSACWSVMFTAFMVALTMTTVANVLVTMAVAPLLTALLSRAVLGRPLRPATWAAIAVAGLGIVWMVAGEVAVADARNLAGTAVAFSVPLAAAINWTAIQHRGAEGGDLLPAVLVGAVLSSLVTLGPALPFTASATDMSWLAGLGLTQLAVPCVIAVAAARRLAAPEAALLSLLEIIFGIAWTWLGAGEAPSRHVLTGGALVLAALTVNEAVVLRRTRLAPT